MIIEALFYEAKQIHVSNSHRCFLRGQSIPFDSQSVRLSHSSSQLSQSALTELATGKVIGARATECHVSHAKPNKSG